MNRYRLSDRFSFKQANFVPSFFFGQKIVSGLIITLAAAMGLAGCSSSTQVTQQTVTSSDPSRQKLDPKEIARTRTAIAAEFIRDHKLDDAKRQLERALESDPKSAQANDMMGVLLQQEGSPSNLVKAEAYFKKAINLDPEFVQANNNYGVYLSQMKRYNEAIAQFQIAGSALGYEGRAGALENLGRTYLKVNNTQAATQTFLKALDADRRSVIARSELIDILLSSGRSLEAKDLYEDLVTLLGEPNLDPRTLTQGIRIAKSTGNNAQLQKLTQQLFDRFPLTPEAKQLRMWLSNPAVTWK